MQIVFEFGAFELSPVIEAVRRVLANAPYSVETTAGTGKSQFVAVKGIDNAASKMVSGEVGEILARPKGGTIRYALVLRPHLFGPEHSFYLGTIESTANEYKSIWNTLLDIPDLKFACVGFEEGVELTDAQITKENFPWNEWPLVIGAIRDPGPSCEWFVKEGPEARSFRPNAKY